MFLDPTFNGMLGLSNVNLITFAGDAVNTWCFKAEFILGRPKETGNFPRWEVYSFDVISH